MQYTMYNTYTNAELIRLVEGAADSSPLTVELTLRLSEAIKESPTDLTDKLRELAELLDERYGNDA